MILRAAPINDLALLLKKPVRADIVAEFHRLAAAKSAIIGIFLKQAGRHFVDALVGALRRENGRHQQLPAIAMEQRHGGLGYI